MYEYIPAGTMCLNGGPYGTKQFCDEIHKGPWVGVSLMCSIIAIVLLLLWCYYRYCAIIFVVHWLLRSR